jgi:hypothetical protein
MLPACHSQEIHTTLENWPEFQVQEAWPAIEEKLEKVKVKHHLEKYTFRYASDPSLTQSQELWDLRDEDNLEDLIQTSLEKEPSLPPLILQVVLAPPGQTIWAPNFYESETPHISGISCSFGPLYGYRSPLATSVGPEDVPIKLIRKRTFLEWVPVGTARPYHTAPARYSGP